MGPGEALPSPQALAMQMRVNLFGATEMVGQGVLRECLVDAAVDSVLSIVCRAASPAHAKLRKLIHPNFLNSNDVRSELFNLESCFFCLGVTSAGTPEAFACGSPYSSPPRRNWAKR